MQKIGPMMISGAHTKLFWMPWQTKMANYFLCMAVVELVKHLFGQRFYLVYEGKEKSCLQLPHHELHLCYFWAIELPIQDSRFRLICTMSRLATSHNRWKRLSWCVKLLWSFGMRHRWCIIELSKLLIRPCVIWCNWMMHMQSKRFLVGIFDKSCLLFPREDEKTLSMLHYLDHIFGSMLRFFVFISTCESWQLILKSNKSLPNGWWMLETTIFLPL